MMVRIKVFYVVAMLMLWGLPIFGQLIDKDYKDGAIYVNVHQECGEWLRSADRSRRAALPETGNPDRSAFAEVLQRYGFQESDNYFAVLDAPVFKNTFEIRFSRAAEVDAFLADLAKCACVHYAEKVPMWYPTYRPNDPQFNSQYTMNVTQAQAAWDIHRGAKREVVIAVVDDAIRIEHEDLKPSLWVNRGEIPQNGIDDDGNGYVDDVNGFDVANFTSNPSPPASNLNNFGHGTHCAGIACATTDNSRGVASLGYDSKLMAIKAKNTNNTGGGIDATGPGIVYAIANKADVLSMSFGGGGNSNTIQNVFNFGRRQGTLNIAAAGNDDTNLIFYPAGADNVLAVASTDWTDGKSGFSNYGDWIGISAPGSGIFSTFVFNNASYGNSSGTSMACPNVAGLAGYLFSYHPNVTIDDVLQCLLSGADNIDGQNQAYIGQLGAGRINARKSIQCLASMPPQVRLQFPRVHYAEVPAFFKNKSLNSQFSRWRVAGEEITQDSFYYTFQDLGKRDVSLTIAEGVSQASDIQILPVLPVPYERGVPGYQGNFEGNVTHFAAENIQGSLISLGNSSIVGKSGVNSGQQAFVLAPGESAYQPNTFANLYTPMFDFTEDGLYEISFYAKFDLGSGLDGFHVEYTVDEGKTWRKLGDASSSWYNFTNTSLGISAYLLGDSYFSSRQLNYKQFRYNVTREVVGKKAAFRFVFISQGSRSQVGFAVDDFEVQKYDGELATRVTEQSGIYNKDRHIVFTWSTQPEFHCKRFRVEMSTNGRDFKQEGIVQANNFSVAPRTYSLTSPAPRNRDLYFYRLYVINEDENGNDRGSFYTDPIAVSKGFSDVELFDHSPNPTVDFVGFSFTQNLKVPLRASVYSTNGQRVQEYTLPAGQAYYQISLGDIPPGTYVVSLEFGEGSTQRKSVKVIKM
jgi:hypothetical protein